MKNISKITKIVTKILEVAHWAATALMLAAAVCSIAAEQWVRAFIDIDGLKKEAEACTYGFEIAVLNSDGEINMKALTICAFASVLILALMAMIFRNLYLIIKKSENNTPFQKDNIRMVREIGIFSIAIPSIALIMSIIARLFLNIDAVDTSVRIDGFIMGIIMLCLTQVFTRGTELENDMDGLI